MARGRAVRDEGFRDRLRGVMEERRVRPAALARTLGVHPTTISRWRRGELPDPGPLTALAQALAVRQEWLKTGQGARDEPQAPSALAGTARRSYGAILKVLGDDVQAGRMVPPDVALDHVTSLWRAVTREAPALAGPATPAAADVPPPDVDEMLDRLADESDTPDTG